MSVTNKTKDVFRSFFKEKNVMVAGRGPNTIFEFVIQGKVSL
jgi:hypothetical protein